MKHTIVIFAALLLAPLAVSTHATDSPAATTNRMEWWRDARFGMFIHWGLYAQLGGEWKGKDYGKEQGGPSAEWIMKSANIPPAEYAQVAQDFNPVKFSAKAWVSAAKAAGMKYIVITSKHHDGFSMFGTKMTPYNIVDATPFKRDPIKELADECKAQGLRFGVYYSHSKDWYHRGPSEANPPSADYEAFVKGQLRELLTNYGDLALIWFDMGDKFHDINTEYGNLVKELQPNCLVSGRLNGNKDISDYHSEGDRRIPAANVTGDAESPMTLRDNWGYDRTEDNWKSDQDMMERFTLCVCRGANMLLNMGPHPDGTLDPHEIHFLKTVGRWMDVNSESIYGTQSSPFNFDFAWGSMTRKANTLYLQVLKWNPAGIAFNGLVSKPVRAYLLADPGKQPLAVAQANGITTISVPPTAPDPNVSVIVLEFPGMIETDPQATGKYVWEKGTGIHLVNSPAATDAAEKQSKKAQK